MKKFKFKKMFAFSLVELMISLITISCIAAAFTPVITKKLKKQDVALSLAQTSEITNQCSGYEPKFTDKCKLCTKAYCIQCGIENCEDGKYLDTSYCGCKNCSDNVAIIGEHCAACTKDKCTKCETGYYLKSEIDNKVHDKCQTCRAGNYCEDGIWEKRQSQCNTTYGYFCTDDNVLRSCNYKYSNNCTSCNNEKCLTCSAGSFLSGNDCINCGVVGCHKCNNTTTCISCEENRLLKNNNECKSAACNKDSCEFISHCMYYSSKNSSPATITNYKCSTCYAGYYVANNGQNCFSCDTLPDSDNSGRNCVYCQNNGKCTVCKKGYYVNSSGKCTKCKVTNCTSCSSDGKCGSCEYGYKLENDKTTCVLDERNFNCSDSNFMRVGNLCITRKNMGDSKLLAIPNSVHVVDVNESCYADISKCCWQGMTSPSGSDENQEYSGGYSGRTRTVCNWEAANEICSNFDYAGLKWRLATQSEMADWGRYSINLKEKGLQLCDAFGNYSSAHCPFIDKPCPVSWLNFCSPDAYWTSTYASGKAYVRYVLRNGDWYSTGGYRHDIGFSVRCVAEMDD